MNNKNSQQNFGLSTEPPPFEKPKTLAENVNYIAQYLLSDMVRYTTDAQFSDFNISRYTSAPSKQLPEMHCFVIDFNDPEKKEKFLSAIREANQDKMNARIGSSLLMLNIQENKLIISVKDVEKLADFVEEVIFASDKKIAPPKPIIETVELNDADITNLRLMPAQFGFSSAKRIVRYYNSCVADERYKAFQGFTFSPDDLIRAENTLKKQQMDVKEIPSGSLLHFH